MTNRRIEYEFLTSLLMANIRKANPPGVSLRDLEAQTGISISAFSRWDNGSMPDMDSFMKCCAVFNLIPGDYFKQVVWVREG